MPFKSGTSKSRGKAVQPLGNHDTGLGSHQGPEGTGFRVSIELHLCNQLRIIFQLK